MTWFVTTHATNMTKSNRRSPLYSMRFNALKYSLLQWTHLTDTPPLLPTHVAHKVGTVKKRCANTLQLYSPSIQILKSFKPFSSYYTSIDGQSDINGGSARERTPLKRVHHTHPLVCQYTSYINLQGFTLIFDEHVQHTPTLFLRTRPETERGYKAEKYAL